MHKKDAPENALKGALQVALELHLFMELSVHKSIQNNSTKREIGEARYVALEDASKISFYRTFINTAEKTNGPLDSAIDSSPEGTLKLHLRMH